MNSWIVKARQERPGGQSTPTAGAVPSYSVSDDNGKGDFAHIEDSKSGYQKEFGGSQRTHSSAEDEAAFGLAHAETFQTTYEQALEIYRDGELILMPAASRDPKDPMNMTFQRKVIGVFCLSFFGALAASAEIILGACLPVFKLEYAGVPEPGKYLQQTVEVLGGFPAGTNALHLLEAFPKGPSVFDIYLLAALPLLMIGVSNLFLVPLAIAWGRRPVLLLTGMVAIAGAVWAGASKSHFGQHLAARCVQAVGAGTVESLIPFIIQDIVHVHERNTWISAAFAAQGVIIIAIGFSAPYVIVNMSWHWVYYITAAAAAFFLIGVFFFLPETRWNRTRAEMNGIPRNDAHIKYEPRSYKKDLYLFNGKVEWMKGWNAFVDTMKTFFYPQIFFITMLNGVMISSSFAASYTAAPALLTKPYSWPFKHLGFCLVAVLIAAIAVAVVQGRLADMAANFLAKKSGKRIPENQLINLVLPTVLGLLGALLFGLAGGDQVKYPWPVFLLALGFMAFGFLGTSAIGTVYVLECYPHLAGPALVSIASWRFIIAFCLTFEASNWTLDLGYLNTFLIYTALIAAFMLFIPIVYFFGPGWRKKWGADTGRD